MFQLRKIKFNKLQTVEDPMTLRLCILFYQTLSDIAEKYLKYILCLSVLIRHRISIVFDFLFYYFDYCDDDDVHDDDVHDETCLCSSVVGFLLSLIPASIRGPASLQN